ncbi:sugar transferase [Pseudotabrizicola sp.]|uniref:sugar transferase n=1 Tax=Pseudotabrizicola sp. TaxID=2939647 RepID=UPI002731B12D|nr:sugar transferase [Pseudotabrizicola sp.]MDP2081855.1 sugar transferase [Pseudotabrizicola sp.]
MSFTFPEFPARTSEPVKSPPDFTGLPLLSQARPFGLYRSVFKRVLDVAAIVLAAPVVVPVVASLALGVALDGGKPFYSQLRIGKGGEVFRMWKLRSMVRDADAQMEELLKRDPAARHEWDTTQKLRNDPRITRFGLFLRRSSLDELPQLWNVLTGSMSLVGPRPMMVDQRSLYPGTAYYALRPGITGYWQTAGRNRTTFRARAEYDTVYEEGLAFATDLRILWRTVNVVMNGTGC